MYDKELLLWLRKGNFKRKNLESIGKYAASELTLFHANSALLKSHHLP